MSTHTEIRQNIVDSTRAVLDTVYDLIVPGTPIEYKTITLAEKLGMSQAVTDDRCIELTSLGILSRTINYGRYNPDGTYNLGRFAMWDLHMSKAEAKAKVDEWAKGVLAGTTFLQGTIKAANSTKKRRRKAQTEAVITANEGTPEARPAIATNETEDTKAIAGPDAPSPFARLAPLRKADDAAALIAAARQYADREDKVQEHIAALAKTAKDLGIEIDEAVLAAGIKLPYDERLEAVGLVLPVINALEKKNERLQEQMTTLREKGAAHDQLVIDNRRLRTRVETLVSDRVITQQRTQA